MGAGAALTMDLTRISLARLLEADVPLTWQEAVAIVQEVAMVSDVNAAMNGTPSLVTLDTCVLTSDGEIDLPETADDEAPGAVLAILRAVLRGREAPPALEALAGRRVVDDLFGELEAFSPGPRRPVIAALVSRAESPSTVAPPSPVAAPAAAVVHPPATSGVTPTPARAGSASAPTRPPSPPHAPLVPVQAPPFSATAHAVQFDPLPEPWPAPRLVHPLPEPPRRAAAVPPPFVASRPSAVVALSPPFRAADMAPPGSADAAAADAELQRLRARAAGLDDSDGRWPSRLATWLSWRPAFLDARFVAGAIVISGAVIVAAAVTTLVWRAVPATPARTLAVTPTAGTTVPAPGADTPRVDTTNRAPQAGVPSAPTVTRRASRVPVAPSIAARDAAPLAAAASPSAPVATASSPTAARPDSPPPAVGTPAPAPSVGGPRSGATAIVIPSLEPAPQAAARSSREVTRTRLPIYSAQDRDVTPPVMLRQQLPSPLLEPGAEVSPNGPFLEILVDERGGVEQVRLRARQPQPGQTWYRHRMLLAAAKAWQFEPALLAEQPVRYLMRVPLEP